MLYVLRKIFKYQIKYDDYIIVTLRLFFAGGANR